MIGKAPTRRFTVKLSKYQYKKLLRMSYSHEDAEQTIREALAKHWKDDRVVNPAYAEAKRLGIK